MKTKISTIIDTEIYKSMLDLFEDIQKKNTKIQKYIQECLSKYLEGTSEDKPLLCDIPVEYENTFGMSSLDLQHVMYLYKADFGDWIYVEFEGSATPVELGYLSTYEQIQILEGLIEAENNS